MFEKGLKKAKLNQPSAGVSAKNSVLMESNVQRTSKRKKVEICVDEFSNQCTCEKNVSVLIALPIILGERKI